MEKHEVNVEHKLEEIHQEENIPIPGSSVDPEKPEPES